MPKKITTLKYLLQTKRFKKSTNDRTFTSAELKQIEVLFDHIVHINKQSIANTSIYNLFITLISYDLTNLIKRYEYVRDNSCARTQKTFIARYGEAEGIRRWNIYKNKQSITNSFEYKQEKYGWDINQFKAFNKSRAVTLELCIKRHGPIEGKKRWNEYIVKQKYTNSLEYYVKKYGSDGYHKWSNYNKDKGKSMDIQWIMSTHTNGDRQDAEKLLSTRFRTKFTSAAEIKFIDELEKALNTPFRYSTKTRQFCIWNPYTRSPCFYDIVCTEKMKIIEFNGDYWHCNKNIYSADFYHIQQKKYAKDIWRHDELKYKIAQERGFDIKIVWESEFNNDREQIIMECIKWLR